MVVRRVLSVFEMAFNVAVGGWCLWLLWILSVFLSKVTLTILSA